MLDRGRYYKIALFAATFVFGLVGILFWFGFNSYQTQHVYERKKATEQQTVQHAAKGVVCRPPALCADAAESFTPVLTAELLDYSHHYDLKAQQDIAEWTYSLLGVGVLGLIATVIGIGFVYENLREMRRQSAIQKEVGENQVKAYLWVPEASLHLRDRSKPEGLLGAAMLHRASIILKLTNNGQTPALNISARATLSVGKISGANAFSGAAPPRFTAESSNESKVDAVMAGEAGASLFLFFPFEREDEVANAFSTDWAIKYGVENVRIAGSVTYKDVFGHTYESQFAFNGLVKETGRFEAMHRVKHGMVMFRKIHDAIERER